MAEEEVKPIFTKEQQAHIDYFRSSLLLKSPETETDPAFKYEDTDLWNILEKSASAHNTKYSMETIPDGEITFAMMLARKEIYWRLATATAPFYPLSAEGAELKKNVRFDHYLALIQQMESEYASAFARFENGLFGALGEVTSYETTTKNNHFKKSNYDRATKPTVKLEASGITSSTVNLDWTKFNVLNGIFARYSVYVQETPIVDEYAENPIQHRGTASYSSVDIHKTKYRATGLKPDTDYYVCVVSRDGNGLFGYSEVKIRTLPVN